MMAAGVQLGVPSFYYFDLLLCFFFQTKTIVMHVKIEETFVPETYL